MSLLSTIENGSTPQGETEGLPDSQHSHSFKPIPSSEIISALMSLKIASENACIRATIAVNNTNAEEAVEWLFSHLNDSDINEPVQIESNINDTLKQWCLTNGFSIDLFHRLQRAPLYIDSLQKLKYLTSENDITELIQELGLRFGPKAAFIAAMRKLKKMDIETSSKIEQIDTKTQESTPFAPIQKNQNETWICSLCEYENIDADELCLMCSTKKPKPEQIENDLKEIEIETVITHKQTTVLICDKKEQKQNNENIKHIENEQTKSSKQIQPEVEMKNNYNDIDVDMDINDARLSCNRCKQEFNENDWNENNVMLDPTNAMSYTHLMCHTLNDNLLLTPNQLISHTETRTEPQKPQIDQKQKHKKTKAKRKNIQEKKEEKIDQKQKQKKTKAKRKTIQLIQEKKEEKIDDSKISCNRCKQEFTEKDWNQNVIMDKGIFFTHLICATLPANIKVIKPKIKNKKSTKHNHNHVTIITNINEKFVDHKSYNELNFAANPELNESEIEGDCHIRDCMIPYRSLKQSNFLKLYDTTTACPDYKDIMNHLPDDLLDDFKECYKTVCKQYTDHIVGRTCVQAWTHEDNKFTASKFYCKLNAALLSDHSELLKEWMYLIRGLNKFLVNTRPKKKIICYRKSDLSLQQFERIKVDKKYRVAMYTATSTDKEFVKKWNRNSGTFYWIFNVPAGCYNACCIAEYSYHGEESEVLMPPYSSIQIVSKADGYITANVLDNKNCSMDLPTIVA